MDGGLATLRELFEDNKAELLEEYLTEAIINFMALILRNNIPHLKKKWIQKKVTEMGTELDILYANIIMGNREKKTLTPNNTPQISLLFSLIYDNFRIFIPKKNISQGDNIHMQYKS